MKNVQNKALANTDLSIGGASYKGDHGGVFAMDDAHADMLLATPGWSNSARGPEAAPPAFDPVAAMAGGDGDELAAVQAVLNNARGEVTQLQRKLQTSEAARADLQLAVQSKDTEIAQLKAAAEAEPETAAAPAAPASAPVPPAPGATSATETPAAEAASDGKGEAADDEGPQLDGMDKKQLLAVAKKWDVDLTAAQQKLGADKLRLVLDKEIYGD